jgi:hypothetical protein
MTTKNIELNEIQFAQGIAGSNPTLSPSMLAILLQKDISINSKEEIQEAVFLNTIEEMVKKLPNLTKEDRISMVSSLLGCSKEEAEKLVSYNLTVNSSNEEKNAALATLKEITRPALEKEFKEDLPKAESFIDMICNSVFKAQSMQQSQMELQLLLYQLTGNFAKQSSEAAQKNLDKLNDQIKKQDELTEKQKTSSKWSKALMIIACVVSAVLSFVTFGVTGFLCAAALAALTLTNATPKLIKVLAEGGSKLFGGDEKDWELGLEITFTVIATAVGAATGGTMGALTAFGLSSSMTNAIHDGLVKAGVSDEIANFIQMGVQLIATIAMLYLSFGTGAAKAANAVNEGAVEENAAIENAAARNIPVNEPAPIIEQPNPNVTYGQRLSNWFGNQTNKDCFTEMGQNLSYASYVGKFGCDAATSAYKIEQSQIQEQRAKTESTLVYTQHVQDYSNDAQRIAKQIETRNEDIQDFNNHLTDLTNYFINIYQAI